MGHRPPGADVVEGRLGVVEQHVDGLEETALLHDLVVLPVVGGNKGVVDVVHVQVARSHGQAPGVAVGDGSEHHAVQVGQGAPLGVGLPVVGVAVRDQILIGDPGVEDERPGADRVGRPVGVGVLARCGQVAHLARQHVGQTGEGPVVLHLEGEVVDDRPAIQRSHDLAGEGALPQGVEVRGHGVGVGRRSVMEGDAGAHPQRPDGEVRVRLERFQEVGPGRSGVVLDGERVEDGAHNGVAGHGALRGRRVPAVGRLPFEAEHQLASVDRLGDRLGRCNRGRRRGLRGLGRWWRVAGCWWWWWWVAGRGWWCRWVAGCR